jgi:hypothetical protein
VIPDRLVLDIERPAPCSSSRSCNPSSWSIKARIEVLSTRPTRKPGRGVVRIGITALNQRGETVQEGANTLLVRG